VVPGDLVGTEGDWQDNYADYLGCIHSLDTNLGRIRAELDLLGIADRTLVIYTSDHGSHFRTRNGEYKRSCHEASIRIPMIACGPGFSGGRVVSNLVSLIDLPPTILDAGGVEPPPTMRGWPLQSLLGETPGAWREEVFVQISESQVGRAIRTSEFKFAVTAPDKSGVRDPVADRYVEQYLYDLRADPHERNNLVRDPGYAGVRSALAARLLHRMAEAGEPAAQIVPCP
jgi:uncharacterized sulfatase